MSGTQPMQTNDTFQQKTNAMTIPAMEATIESITTATLSELTPLMTDVS